MKIEDALYMLSFAGITNSIQQVRKWVREGKIKATLINKREGYEIDIESLKQFIDEKLEKHKRYLYMQFEKEHNIDTLKDRILELEEKVESLREKNKALTKMNEVLSK